MNVPSAMTRSHPPSVSFILWAYNQERYVAEAVRSALAQRCPPIDIVISDDCSQDGTFSVIEREVAAYTGPHRIRINRNERNLGLAAHFSKCMREAATDWVVCAAGDDISHPERVAHLLDAIEQVPDLVGFGSAVLVIDEAGVPLGRSPQAGGSLRSMVARLRRWLGLRRASDRASASDRLVRFVLEDVVHVGGSSSAWKRCLVTDFPPIHPDAPEDYVLSFRAAAVGRVVESEAPLVQYRTHAQNAWSASNASMSEDQRSRLRERKSRLAHAMFSQNLVDLDEMVRRSLVSVDLARQLAAVIRMKDALVDAVWVVDWEAVGLQGACLVDQGLRLRRVAPGGRLGRRLGRLLQGIAIALARRDLRYRAGRVQVFTRPNRGRGVWS